MSRLKKRSYKGGPRYHNRKKKKRLTLLEKDTERLWLKLIHFYYSRLGGPKNVVLREAEMKEIEKMLELSTPELKEMLKKAKRSIEYIELWSTRQLLDKVKEFLQKGYFTSTSALRQAFHIDIDDFVADLGLEEGPGSEIEELDMPPELQAELLCIISEIIHNSFFHFTREYLPEIAEDISLTDPRKFEMSKDNREEFFETAECFDLLRKRKPGIFDREEFKEMIEDTTEIRNTCTHYHWVTVDYIIEAAEVAISALRTLGEDDSHDELFLRSLIRELKNWKSVSTGRKKTGLNRLVIFFDKLDQRQADESKPIEERDPKSVFDKAKNIAATRMLKGLKDDGIAMAMKFSDLVVRLRADPTERLQYFTQPILYTEISGGRLQLVEEESEEKDDEPAASVNRKRQSSESFDNDSERSPKRVHIGLGKMAGQ